MEISDTYFTGSYDLSSTTLAFATMKDGTLLFVWNLHRAREAAVAEDWDAIFETANQIIKEAIDANTPTPVVVRLAS